MIDVRDASRGEINAFTDDEMVDAYRWLANKEGIFYEPASAALVAGLLKVKNQVSDRARVVCILTGNGLKDPSTPIKSSLSQCQTVLSQL